MASDLTKAFDISRQTPSGHSLDELRQQYFIQASMNGSDAASIGGMNINTNGRKSTAMLAKEKQQQATNDMIMLANLQRQLEAIENNMIDKYGEDFAEQFAAQYLDEKTFKAVMVIENVEKRREAIAQAINDGVKNGTIDPDEVYANPDFTEWLDKHDEIDVAEHLNSTIQNENAEASHNNDMDDNLSNDLNSLFTI